MLTESFSLHTNILEDDIESQNLDLRLIFPYYIPTEETIQECEPVESEHEKEDKEEESSINKSHNSNSSKISTDFANKKTELNKKRKSPHNRLTSDNLLRKIQVHYFTFIISFLNFLLKHFNYKHKFFQLDYSIKKNINKNANKRKIRNENKIIINSFGDYTIEKIISKI